MKINVVGNVGGVNKYNGNQSTRASQTSGKNNPKDEVIISNEAKELLDAQGTSEVNPIIQELKQQVSAGTYSVDARKVAEKLLPYLK